MRPGRGRQAGSAQALVRLARQRSGAVARSVDSVSPLVACCETRQRKEEEDGVMESEGGGGGCTSILAVPATPPKVSVAVKAARTAVAHACSRTDR